MIRFENLKFQYSDTDSEKREVAKPLSATEHHGTLRPELEHCYHFAVPQHDRIGVFGANGSGKTTLFSLFSGLLAASAGDISIGDQSILGLSPHLRGISMIFQNYNLFEHLNIAQNLNLVAKLAKDSNHSKDSGQSKYFSSDHTEPQDLIQYYLEKVGIAPLYRKKPSEISGGERQKASLVRSLIEQKGILLYDEPLSALDPQSRTSIMEFLLTEVLRNQQTLFIVGHNPLELKPYLNKVIYLVDCRVYFVGTIDEFLSSDDPKIISYFKKEP